MTTALLLTVAAPAPDTDPTRVGALVVLAFIAWRIVLAALYPNAPHARCHGTGKLRSPGGRTWRRCPGCRGTGAKLRLSRRIWNWSRTQHGDTTRRRP